VLPVTRFKDFAIFGPHKCPGKIKEQHVAQF